MTTASYGFHQREIRISRKLWSSISVRQISTQMQIVETTMVLFSLARLHSGAGMPTLRTQRLFASRLVALTGETLYPGRHSRWSRRQEHKFAFLGRECARNHSSSWNLRFCQILQLSRLRWTPSWTGRYSLSRISRPTWIRSCSTGTLPTRLASNQSSSQLETMLPINSKDKQMISSQSCFNSNLLSSPKQLIFNFSEREILSNHLSCPRPSLVMYRSNQTWTWWWRMTGVWSLTHLSNSQPQWVTLQTIWLQLPPLKWHRRRSIRSMISTGPVDPARRPIFSQSSLFRTKITVVASIYPYKTISVRSMTGCLLIRSITTIRPHFFQILQTSLKIEH